MTSERDCMILIRSLGEEIIRLTSELEEANKMIAHQQVMLSESERNFLNIMYKIKK